MSKAIRSFLTERNDWLSAFEHINYVGSEKYVGIQKSR